MKTNDNQITSFLGRGWAFPVSFSQSHFGAEMLSEDADIKSSLEILLSTNLGERVMRPDFGTKIKDRVFQTIDVSTATLIADEVRRAILFHEPRIKVEQGDIEVLQDELNGRVELIINYTIITTNTRSNLVYPFYFNEATNVPS
jgi:hypothetical protein